MSSTASNVSATPAVAPSPWPQTPAANQDNGSGPFAALLDAATAAPDTANTQPAAPHTAADQPATKFSTPRNNNGATQGPAAPAPAGAPKPATATPVASSNPAVNPGAAQNATANQAGTVAPGDTTGATGATALNAFVGQAANVVTAAAANAAAPDVPPKTASDNGNQDDSSNTTDASATAATGVQAQPVAAAVVANAIINTPPAPAAAAPDTAIGGSVAASAKSALPLLDAKTVASGQDAGAADANTVPTLQDVKISAAGQDTKAAAPAQDASIAVAAQDAKIATPKLATPKVATAAQGAKATAPGKQTSATGSSAPAANAAAGSPADAANGQVNGQVWNGSSAPQLQTQADSDPIIPAQSGNSGATHGDALAATPASVTGGSSTGWNAAKAATEGLPNFGIVANQAAPAAAAATPGTAAATVPVAGLAVAIASRAQAGSSQFDIRLDPPELGRIDVRLDVDRNGQVTSHVTVDRADTLQLLQNQQPQLERALEQAGLKTADNGLQFTLRDQSFAGQNGGSGGGAQPSAAHLVIPDADQPVIQATQIYSRAGLGSGVDIRV